MISSQSAMLSKDVQRELQYANRKNKKKLEYKIDDSVHTSLFKYAFDGLKWINAIEKPSLEELKSRIFELVNKNDISRVENELLIYLENGDFESIIERVEEVL